MPAQEPITSETPAVDPANVTNEAATPAAQPPTPLIIAPEIQWTLATRTMLHWVACVSYFAVVLFFSQLMYDPEQSLVEHIKSYSFDALHWLPAILLLLPLAVYDTMRVSNRVISPVLKVRDGLQAIVAGKETETLESPEDAYFHDLVELYNEVHKIVDQVDGIEMSDEEADAELDALLG